MFKFLHKPVSLFFIIALVLLSIPNNAKAASTWDLVGSDTFNATTNVSLQITDLQVTGSTTIPVPVKLRVTSGSLQMATTTGITFTGPSSGATLQFTGTFSNVNAALASLTYLRGTVGSDTLEVSLIDPTQVFFPDNGHLYEYISNTTTWNQAHAAAALLTKYDAVGYLTTITSQAENDFAAARLAGAGWMGASDSGVEGTWKWVEGPENNTTFWQGTGSGNTVGGNYANWGSGEPNNAGDEDCAQFLSGGSGQWNDLPCNVTTLPGYVVEYGAPGALPTVTAKNITITTQTNPVLNTVTPTAGAINQSTTTNLVAVFSKTIATSTGNLTIKKSIGNATVETFAATSSRISKTALDTITIDPTVNLENNTQYYVLIDNTFIRDLSANAYAGISATSTWSFTTIKTPLVIALEKIQAYASSTGTTTAPTISDYADAGITGLSTSTLIVANSAVASSTPSTITTTETLQTVIAPVVAVETIRQYALTTGTSTAPTITDYSNAGVTGVTTSNLAQINAALRLVTPLSVSNLSGIQSLTNNVIATLATVPEKPYSSLGLNGGVIYGCKDKTASNYDQFSSSMPSLCIFNGKTTTNTGIQASVPIANVATVRDLKTGMIGSDVVALQKLLNANGYAIASSGAGSPGKETALFGGLTRSALAKYQKANGVTPAIGYFGVVTRTQMKTASTTGMWW